MHQLAGEFKSTEGEKKKKKSQPFRFPRSTLCTSVVVTSLPSRCWRYPASCRRWWGSVWEKLGSCCVKTAFPLRVALAKHRYRLLEDSAQRQHLLRTDGTILQRRRRGCQRVQGRTASSDGGMMCRQSLPDDHTRDSMCPMRRRRRRRLTTRSCPGAENGIPAAARCVTSGDVNTGEIYPN